MFPISPKLLIPILLFVGMATAGYFTYKHITLQGEAIASLRASEAVLKLSLESATNTANANAEHYVKLANDKEQLLSDLKVLQDNIDKLKKESTQREKEFNEYVKSLPQDSFEAQCYSMPVIKSKSISGM